jgi:methanogenic corrinoid protein MtbC1
MPELDIYQSLIHNLLELEEAVVLDQVRAQVQAGEDPYPIIAAAQQAMRMVGERYEEGDYYISSMMMAGEIFREVMEILEPVIEQQTAGNEAGQVLLATVKGDIHDIGKNIFSMLLRSHGFQVTDLGVDVSPDHIIQEVQAARPEIIALSGLLTVSYDSMKETVQKVRKQADRQAAQTPIIIGGGTMNPMVCSYVGSDYWASDAMLGVQLCKQIMEERKEKPPHLEE